jgi:SAM-dependent methyltransferase
MSQEEAETFFRGLHWRAESVGRMLAASYDFSRHRSLVDVGGGSGGLAIAITEACPQIQATVVDLPTVTPITRRYVEEAGAGERVQVVTADVVNGPLAGSYDVAAMRALIQVLSASEAQRALINVGKALEPGGVLYIVSTGLLDNSRISPPETVAFNLVFLNIYDHGQAYTEQEHRDWLTEAGFEGFERIKLPDASSIVIARKPS